MTDLGNEIRKDIHLTQKRINRNQYREMRRTWDLMSPLLETTRKEVLSTFKKFPRVRQVVFNRNGTVQLVFMVDKNENTEKVKEK